MPKKNKNFNIGLESVCLNYLDSITSLHWEMVGIYSLPK